MSNFDSLGGRLRGQFSGQVTEARRFVLRTATEGTADRGVVVGGGYEVVDRGYFVGHRTLPFIGLEMVASGKGDGNLAGRPIDLAAGVFVIYDERTPHTFATSREKPLHKYFLDLDPRPARRHFRRLNLPTVGCWRLRQWNDLTRLFVGSEGTLGVITEITVRLFGRPEAVSAAVCAFDSIDEAVRAVIQTIQFGIPVARIELMDEVQIDAVNRYSKLSYPVKPTLLFEFHATSEAGAAEHATAVQEIAAEHGGTEFRWATTTEDRATLWAARHNTYYAALAMRPGGKAWVTDVCVPISALAECIAETKRELAASRAYAPLVGHVGDGNFHLNFILDPNDPREVEEVKALNGRLVARALRLGGTCTGEHGIGLGKQKYLLDEHGEDAVAVMRALKTALDPAGLMNPGKIFA